MVLRRWLAADMSRWQGRVDSDEQGDTRRLFNIVKPLRPFDNDKNLTGAKVLLGFGCDAGVRRNQGRIGAAQGPEAIRRALAGLPAHHLTQIYDAGDILCNDDALEDTQQALALTVDPILNNGGFPLILGGGHEIAWGSWQGLRNYLDAKADYGSVLIINLDAHFDLRTARPGSSGTPFDQIASATSAAGLAFNYVCLGISRLSNTAALFAQAKALKVQYIEDIHMQERQLDSLLKTLDQWLQNADHIYLSVDLDVLPAAVMPAVSAPAAFGVPLSVIEAVIEQVSASGKLRLADIAEFNPHFDQDSRGARVAARLAYNLLNTKVAPFNRFSSSYLVADQQQR